MHYLILSVYILLYVYNYVNCKNIVKKKEEYEWLLFPLVIV